jgi:hypothetical protein
MTKQERTTAVRSDKISLAVVYEPSRVAKAAVYGDRQVVRLDRISVAVVYASEQAAAKKEGAQQ